MSDLTIRDIAKIAGVSTTAVSFVLNNRPGVSDATRQHVQEVIARTGFTPNVHTRRLNLGRSFSIHVVLYWHEHDLFNQFALEILHGVFQSCKQLGYSVVFTFVEKNMDCSQLMASIRSKDCDGVILSQIEDPLFITLLQQEHIPFVCVDSHVRRDGTLPLVEVDYYKAAYDSVMYLRRCGHTKIGYIAPTIPLELHLSTFSGYTNALRDCSLTCDPAWIGNIAFEPDAAGLYFEQLLQTGRALMHRRPVCHRPHPPHEAARAAYPAGYVGHQYGRSAGLALYRSPADDRDLPERRARAPRRQRTLPDHRRQAV